MWLCAFSGACWFESDFRLCWCGNAMVAGCEGQTWHGMSRRIQTSTCACVACLQSHIIMRNWQQQNTLIESRFLQSTQGRRNRLSVSTQIFWMLQWLRIWWHFAHADFQTACSSYFARLCTWRSNSLDLSCSVLTEALLMSMYFLSLAKSLKVTAFFPELLSASWALRPSTTWILRKFSAFVGDAHAVG